MLEIVETKVLYNKNWVSTVKFFFTGIIKFGDRLGWFYLIILLETIYELCNHFKKLSSDLPALFVCAIYVAYEIERPDTSYSGSHLFCGPFSHNCK